MAVPFNQLKEGEIILFVTPAEKYLSTNLEILKYYLNKQKDYCVYVTVNRPYASLITILKREKVATEKLFVIDAITPIGGAVQRAGNAVFIGSPQALTNISIAVTSAVQSLPKGKRFLFFDTVSALIVYNNTGSVTKFTHFLITKMREWDITGVLISLEKETDEKMLSQLTQFCDRCINIK